MVIIFLDLWYIHHSRQEMDMLETWKPQQGEASFDWYSHSKCGFYHPGRKHHVWLVVESYPSEKYGFVSWDDEIPIYIPIEINIYNWLVVLTILKNMNQWEGWHPIYEMDIMENKNHVWNHQPDVVSTEASG